MKILHLFWVPFLLFSFSAISQPICGFDDIQKDLLKKDPAYAKRMVDNDLQIQEYIKNHPISSYRTAAALYTIPVVVHVMHTGGAIGTIYNPSDAQIKGAIDYLNSIYNGTNATLSGGVGDIQIQFALAQRDPNCNPTNGIDRVDVSSNSAYVTSGVNRSSTGGITDATLKNLARWNTASYYNIWVVNKIDSKDGTSGQFVAGYAYFPGASSTSDGTVMLATQMKTGAKTLPHEIGHALNLYHVFEGSSSSTVCPTNTPCNINGDRVCDTDPISYNYNSSTGAIDFSCRTGTNSCTGTVYSINTESNFMNYTNCYTLFTEGQKSRMLAAMSLSSRASLATSSGAIPTYLSPNCTPKINFELSTDVITEKTTSVISCRKYTDYVYKVTIGSYPSANTNVKIVATGTAKPISDFELLDSILNFETGKIDTINFTLRVYDDASYEATEKIILNLQINNNGGNAVLGDSKPTLTITLNDNDDTLPPSLQRILTSTLGVQSTTYESIFYNTASSRSQLILTAAELKAAGVKPGQISAIAFNVTTKNTTQAIIGFSVIGTNSTAVAVPGFITGAPTLYTGNYTTVSGWNTITFDNKLTWDGTSNLLFQFCHGTIASPTGTKDQIAYIPSTGKEAYFSSTGACSGSVSYNYFNTIKPQCRLTYIVPETNIETTVVLSKEEYIAPNDDIYFYSPNNKLIARIENLSVNEYGCTTVGIDRAGTSAQPFWIDSTKYYLADKTFKINTTNVFNNNDYRLTLYYTRNEINGWASTTGRNIDGCEMIQTDSSINNVTPTNINGAGLVNVYAAEKDSIAGIKIITQEIASPFSSYGIGQLIDITYTFIGNGNWSDPANWQNGIVPPLILPAGSRIIINPVNGGECYLNVSQTLNKGSLFSILPNKKLRLSDYLLIE